MTESRPHISLVKRESIDIIEPEPIESFTSVAEPTEPVFVEPVHETRRVSLVSTDGLRWNVIFDGKITRRDMNRIRRLLTVEFAVRNRRQSLEYLKKRRNQTTSESHKETTDGPAIRKTERN